MSRYAGEVAQVEGGRAALNAGSTSVSTMTASSSYGGPASPYALCAAPTAGCTTSAPARPIAAWRAPSAVCRPRRGTCRGRPAVNGVRRAARRRSAADRCPVRDRRSSGRQGERDVLASSPLWSGHVTCRPASTTSTGPGVVAGAAVGAGEAPDRQGPAGARATGLGPQVAGRRVRRRCNRSAGSGRPAAPAARRRRARATGGHRTAAGGRCGGRAGAATSSAATAASRHARTGGACSSLASPSVMCGQPAGGSMRKSVIIPPKLAP